MQYKHRTWSREYLMAMLSVYLHEAFDVYKDGVKEGVVFSLKVGDKYTMDGYHSGKDALSAVKAGRLLCERLFKITDEIWTCHKVIERSVTAVCKRIGFKVTQTVNDNVVLIYRRQHGD